MWAILTGLKSQAHWLRKGFQQYILSDTLENSFRDWIYNQFPNLIQQAGQAAALKFEQKHNARASAENRIVPGKVPVAHSTAYHYTQNIYPVHTEGWSALMRRARFEYEVGTKRHQLQVQV